MRSLFLKIFVILWIAQSLIFIISTVLILRQHFPHPDPDVLFDTLSTSLQNEAKEGVAAFESGGCDALNVYAAAHGHAVALENAAGTNLCGARAITIGTGSPDHITGKQIDQQYIWRVPVTSEAGKKYLFLLSQRHARPNHSWPHDLLHFAFPQLPVAIAVGGVTTFVLVLLFTRPLVRLRKAARELAQSNLSVRVPEVSSSSRFFSEDEFQALVHDFNHMAERLESLVGAQQLLLRDVSHELRSPLARLSVALELAREDAAPEMIPHLDRMEREMGRLNQLIGQLLTLSSMEALERQDSFEPMSLNEVIEEMMPDAEYEATQRQSSIVFAASGECTISGNRQLLYRAIENVVRNAIRYTATDSEVEILLSSDHSLTGREAVVKISDQGPGIPEAEINNIFDPFYRVDHARSPETGGFGVGLAITERAVKLHKGEVRAFNRKGGGTVICLRFPLIESGDTHMKAPP